MSDLILTPEQLKVARQLLRDEAPVIIPPGGSAPMTPAEAAKGHSTTTVEFPRLIHLTISTNQSVHYPVGVHEVPDHLADHWYLKAHGARVYYRPVAVSEQIADGVVTSGKGKRGANGK